MIDTSLKSTPKKLRILLYVIIGILVLLFSCNTKDIQLITNVNFSTTINTIQEGFVKESLATIITITPQKVLPEFEYYFQYELIKGNGVFEDNEGNTLPTNQKIVLDPELDFTVSLNYKGLSSGDHQIKITTNDNFEKIQEHDIFYTIHNLDLKWTATTQTKTIKKGDTLPIFITLENNSSDYPATFEHNYRFINGEGKLTNLSQEIIEQNKLTPIIPGTYQVNAIPNRVGNHEIRFDLLDSNGQQKSQVIQFNVNENPLSNEAKITTISINNSMGIISDNTVLIKLPAKTDLTNLVPTIGISDKASITPKSNEPQDFTNPVLYNITAEDGSITSYTIEVILEADPLSDENDIREFSTRSEPNNLAQIDTFAHTATLTVPFETDVRNLTPNLVVSKKASYTPKSHTNFTKPVTYTVTAENGDTQNWIVTIKIAPDTRSSKNDITAFLLTEQRAPAIIDTITHTVTAKVLPGTPLTTLSPIIVVSSLASYTPEKAIDFTKPVTYTITAENKETQNWTVIVKYDASIQPGEAFITTWSGTKVIVPVNIGYAYNYNIDWDNDGILDEFGITGEAVHTFPTAGPHTVQITGKYPGIEFINAYDADPKTLLSVDQWGTGEWLIMFHAFKNCSNLIIKATDTPDFSRVSSMASMFYLATKAQPDVRDWDTSSVTNMAYMFSRSGIKNIDITNWNIQNISDMSNMFAGVTLQQDAYEQLLIALSKKTKNNDVTFNGGSSTYCSPLAKAARTKLINDTNWKIQDAGEKCQ